MSDRDNFIKHAADPPQKTKDALPAQLSHRAATRFPELHSRKHTHEKLHEGKLTFTLHQ